MSSTETTEPSPLDCALSYADAGWAVLPLWWAAEGVCACREGAACRRPAKHPRCRGGLESATREPSIIRDWWRRWPTAGVAVATGSTSGGVWVLDVDGALGGRTLVELVRAHGPLGWTLEVHTGGGGAHFYFDGSSLPGGVPTSAGRLGPGLDVRGEGGYVVAPPSIHASGYAYQWVNGQDVLPAPGWLVDLTRPVAANDAAEVAMEAPLVAHVPDLGLDVDAALVERRAAAYVRALPPAISGAGGHAATFAAALALVRGFGLDVDTALRVLEQEHNPRCRPPWSRAELVHKVTSAAQNARTEAGYLLARGR